MKTHFVLSVQALGWWSQYLLIYKMSISDYKQTVSVLKAPTGMVYIENQAAYILRSINNGLL